MVAEDVGVCDAHDGDSQPPLLYQGKEPLVSSWRKGYAWVRIGMEMREGWYCDNGTGDRCPTHG